MHRSITGRRVSVMVSIESPLSWAVQRFAEVGEAVLEPLLGLGLGKLVAQLVEAGLLAPVVEAERPAVAGDGAHGRCERRGLAAVGADVEVAEVLHRCSRS